jgi:hypothetical protein
MSLFRHAPVTLLVALTAACSAPGPGTPVPGGSAAPLNSASPAHLTARLNGLVTGTLRLDAAYAIAVAGARLVEGAGGPYVAVAGAVLSNGGGSLIGNNSAGLVSDGANRWRLPLRLAQAPAGPALARRCQPLA